MKTLTIRRSNERGQAMLDWLQSYHTFSFADYYDPQHTHFRNIRVINEDKIAPGKGFGTHPHQDMEILTYMVAGELAHKDSMGNEKVIRAGELQAMSAGTGIMHSEFNPSQKESTHLLQIWIFPETKGIKPRYTEWKPIKGEKKDLTLLASPEGSEGSAQIMTDAKLYLVDLEKGKELSLPIKSGRYGWLQVIDATIEIGKEELVKGDAAGFQSEGEMKIKATQGGKALLFDVP